MDGLPTPPASSAVEVSKIVRGLMAPLCLAVAQLEPQGTTLNLDTSARPADVDFLANSMSICSLVEPFFEAMLFKL